MVKAFLLELPNGAYGSWLHGKVVKELDLVGEIKFQVHGSNPKHYEGLYFALYYPKNSLVEPCTLFLWFRNKREAIKIPNLEKLLARNVEEVDYEHEWNWGAIDYKFRSDGQVKFVFQPNRVIMEELNGKEVPKW